MAESVLRRDPTPSAVMARGGSWLRRRMAVRPGGGERVRNDWGQVTKGAWWMPRRWKAMKGVGGCDKPGVTANQVLIPGFPNGATRAERATVSAHRHLNA